MAHRFSAGFVLASTFFIACARPKTVAPTAGEVRPPTRPLAGGEPADVPAQAEWTYDVEVGQGARELSISASFPAGSNPELVVDDGAEPFVRDLVVEGERREPVAPSGTSWFAPACGQRGCRIRYRFMLADACSALRDPDLAAPMGNVFVAPPSTWLVRPAYEKTERTFRLRVVTPPDVTFATGLFPDVSDPRTFRARIFDLPAAPYSAFGVLRQHRIDVGGGRAIEVAMPADAFVAGDDAILAWIRGSADVVTKYYGRFPVARVLLLVLPEVGSDLGYGKTLGNGGASILLPIGSKTTAKKLESHWILVHEMLHLAFPTLPREHLWLEEGIATYVEPFARVRAGRLSREEAWSGFIKGLPNGLPESGDRGLDNTHTWGRTYWGGALFCLLADLEIRERTQGRRSLDDALRAVLLGGGDIAVRWELARALEAGDKATGVPVLVDLHKRMGPAPYDVDLPALFRKLGVKLVGKNVVFDESAPLAEVRRKITDAKENAKQSMR